MSTRIPDHLSFLNAVKDTFLNDPEKFHDFLIIMDGFKSERIDANRVAEKVKKLFEGHDQLILGFNQFLPIKIQIKLPNKKKSAGFVTSKGNRSYNLHVDRVLNDDHGDSKHGMKRKSTEKETMDYKNKSDSIFIQEINLCDKVKDKCEAVNYKEFLRCLYVYNKQIICWAELRIMVNHLLEKNPDLIDDFDGFLAHCESSKSFWTEELLDRLTKVEDTNTNWKPKKSSRKKYCETQNNRDSVTLDKSAPCTTKRAAFENFPLSLYKEESNILKLDVSNPSYHRREKINQMLPVSHKAEFVESVLNDEWACVGSLCGQSSKEKNKNPYKKNVLQCDEDRYKERVLHCDEDRFELDMLLRYMDNAIKQVENLMKNDNTKLKSPFRLEDNFTNRSLSCIEHIYGGHGLVFLDILRENPCQALPTILFRLKQKKEEWSRCLLALHEVWGELYDKYQNFEISLQTKGRIT